jgi:hypothetical protein
MLGQSLVEPEDEEPVELLDGMELVDPEELEVDPVPVGELVPDVPAVSDVLLVPVEFVVEVLVAALATSAPPVMRPVVSAPKATASRKRSFMVVCPFWLWALASFPS